MTQNHVDLPPPPRPPAERRRWPVLVAAGVVGAVAATITAAVVTAKALDTTSASAPTALAHVTVTAAPRTPISPARLPVEKADHRTCQKRAEASRLISLALTVQGVIPKGMTIVDPAVRSNPEWAAAVQRAGALYNQAGDSLQVAPGTTQILTNAVTAAAKALHALGTFYASFNKVSSDAQEIAKNASGTMDALCDRLAP